MVLGNVGRCCSLVCVVINVCFMWFTSLSQAQPASDHRGWHCSLSYMASINHPPWTHPKRTVTLPYTLSSVPGSGHVNVKNSFRGVGRSARLGGRGRSRGVRDRAEHMNGYWKHVKYMGTEHVRFISFIPYILNCFLILLSVCPTSRHHVNDIMLGMNHICKHCRLWVLSAQVSRQVSNSWRIPCGAMKICATSHR